MTSEFKEFSISDNANLWNFEKFKKNENYKSWSRYCRNVLEIMSIWHVVNESMSFLIFNDSITTSIIDTNDAIDINIVKKNIAEYNKNITKWITKIKL